MRLLILTQKVSAEDDVLGFFHCWIEECAKRFEKVTVICLEKGQSDLPPDIRVFSLGKENRKSRFSYVLNFFRYIWLTRGDYDAVFVHMNQEYVLLGGIFWRLLGKKIGLWLNHPYGSFATRLAIRLSHVVFCTSPYAYVAPFKKTVLMPVGVDTEVFLPIGGARLPDSIVFLSRFSPIKKPELLIDALALLKQKNLLVSKTVFIGNAAPKDAGYVLKLKEKIAREKLEDYITFRPGLPHREVPALLGQFEVYVNTTPTGSMDKTIFEAMACETIIIVSNKALVGDIPDYLLFKENEAESLSDSIEKIFLKSSTERRDIGVSMRQYVIEKHSLNALMNKLQNIFEALNRK